MYVLSQQIDHRVYVHKPVGFSSLRQVLTSVNVDDPDQGQASLLPARTRTCMGHPSRTHGSDQELESNRWFTLPPRCC